MEALKFETTVLENGIIKISELEGYTDQKVEVFIILKPQKKGRGKEEEIDTFISQWSGFFSLIETNDLKYNYLIDKYKW